VARINLKNFSVIKDQAYLPFIPPLIRKIIGIYSLPFKSMPQEHFAAPWTGKIEAPLAEIYTIYTQSDDGIPGVSCNMCNSLRVWIDNQQVIDDWNDHAASEEKAG
jgi:hypothetical protein